MEDFHDLGFRMHSWMKDMFPLPRSITGPGIRETLQYIKNIIPCLSLCSVPSGTRAFDWIVPYEWTVRDAYISDSSGNRIVDYFVSNLHLVGYSEPIDVYLNLTELQKYLHSLPDKPDSIPYVTSYYERRWGFCIEHNKRLMLNPGIYHVVIDSDIKQGEMNYGEILISGETDEEVFLSTYICHPSMANNELSGPVVTIAIVQWLMSLNRRKYSYRIIFIPETIGSIVYLSRNIIHLKTHVIAGFNITCVGDNRCYSYLPSRSGNSLSDKVALHVLKYIDAGFIQYTWLNRGSDERQYCAPGVDLPIAVMMRSKFQEYPEYHTSLDNLDLVTPDGLMGGYIMYYKAILVIENNVYYKYKILCEPQMSRRNLYTTLSTVGSTRDSRTMMNFLSYCDGAHSALDICDKIGQDYFVLSDTIKQLLDNDLIEEVSVTT